MEFKINSTDLLKALSHIHGIVEVRHTLPILSNIILEAKDGGSVEGKRLTRTVPPKKGPNSQGMRGTGIAISGTKFKGVF